MASRRSSVLLIVLAGFCSAWIGAELLKGDPLWIANGLVFGVALSIYFIAYERSREWGEISFFLSICTLGLPISILCGAVAELCFMHLGQVNTAFTSYRMVPTFVPFIGGAIGGYCVLQSALLSFGVAPKKTRTAIAIVAAGTLCGGIIEALSTRGLGGPLNVREYLPSKLLLTWQPAEALILAILLHFDRQNASETAVTPD